MAYGASSEAALLKLKYYKESQSGLIASRKSSTNRLNPLATECKTQQVLAHDLAKLPKTEQVQDTTTLLCFHERHCIVAYGMWTP